MRHFHLHIYFEPEKLDKARLLEKAIRQINLFDLVKFHDHPVGPHPAGMIETHFSEPVYFSVLAWIKVNRGELSALIHEDTGNDLRDHTEDYRWFGQELPLDFSFFELIQLNPEFRMNHNANED